MSDHIVHLALMLMLMGLSGFFSASETAIFSLDIIRRREMQAAGGRLARLAVRLSEERRLTLRTILLSNLLVNVSFYSLSTTLAIRIARGHEPASASAIAAGVGLGSLVALILFGEIIPKMLAVSFSRAIACVGALPIHTIHRLLRPLWARTDAGFDRVARKLNVGSRHTRPLDTDELQELVEIGEQKGIISQLESSLIAGAVQLADVKVSEVMVPRVDVIAFDADEPIEKLRELVRRTRHTRIPVYRGESDDIVGIVYGREVLLDETDDLAGLLHPPVFVPEVASVGALLEQLKPDGVDAAIAVDEYGGFAGMVTLEDALSEVVGEIEVEAARTEPLIRKLGPTSYQLSGGLVLRDFCELFGLDASFPELDTVGGLVMLLLGRVPSAGDRVDFSGLTFRVENVRGRRIDDVVVEFDPRRMPIDPGRGREERG